MKKPPQSLLPLIALAEKPGTTVDQLAASARDFELGLLRENASLVLFAIPDKDKAEGLIKFAAIHHIIGSDASVFAMLADTCARGEMADEQARRTLEYLLVEGLMPKVPGPFFGALAHGKRRCAELLFSFGLYRVPGGWGSLLTYIEADRRLQMAQLLVEVVNPPRDDLLSLRTAADSGSALALWLDQHLEVRVVDLGGKTRH